MFETLVRVLDPLAVIVFAITGALTASRLRLDIVAFLFIATVTAVGGGTLRDLLLGRGVSWVIDPTPLWLSMGAAVGVWFAGRWIEPRGKLLLWADALALALAAVVGTERALQVGVSGGLAIVFGTMTATFGGVLRDVICNETSLVLRPQIYVSAAAAGAAACVGSRMLGLPGDWCDLLGVGVAFAVRGCAIVFDLRLPGYRPDRGKDGDET
jgi:uncharacterized membrane protein YeiH